MLKLGREHKTVVRIVDDGVSQPITFTWRDPDAAAYLAFRRAMTPLVSEIKRAAPAGEVPEDADEQALRAQVEELVAVYRDLGFGCVLDVEGVEGPDGMSSLEAVRQFAPIALEALGEEIAKRMRKLEADSGKSQGQRE